MEREMAEERKKRRRELVNRELEELLVGDVMVISRKGSRRPAAVLSISEDKYGNPRLNTMDDRGHFLKVSYHQFPVSPANTSTPPTTLSFLLSPNHPKQHDT